MPDHIDQLSDAEFDRLVADRQRRCLYLGGDLGNGWYILPKDFPHDPEHPFLSLVSRYAEAVNRSNSKD